MLRNMDMEQSYLMFIQIKVRDQLLMRAGR